MSAAIVFAVFSVVAVALAIFFLFFYRSWRRRNELQQPFPSDLRKLLTSQVPLYQTLPSELKEQLEHHVQLFLSEKSFYGCDGFEIDDRVRLTIAGHACLLIVGRSYSDYDEVQSILVYPSAYRVMESEQQDMIVHTGEQIRAGEASTLGRVVLSWLDCEEATRPGSEHNVILHEFAHQLDYLDGSADGAPPLSDDQAEQWQQTMTRAYGHLRQSLSHHRKSWLDPYGATEPAEFFAVLTETFFQQPEHLNQEQPEVYQALWGYYRVNPLTFRDGS